MTPALATKPSRLLSVLVVVLLIFLAIAALAVVVMLWATSSVPDGALGLLNLSPDAARHAAIVATGDRRLAVGAVTLESLVVTAVILLTLLRLLRSTSRGTPFVAANVGRLRLIAGAYAVSLVAKCTVPLLVPATVAAWLAASGWSFNLGDAGAFLFALVLAEVFREGVRLREDSDATV